MVKRKISFASATVTCYFNAKFTMLPALVNQSNTFIITDELIYSAHTKKFKEWQVIVIPSGEEQKTQSTVDGIITELIRLNANRQSFLLGVGGGVITDITGYVASIFMRGIAFGFVPTTVLAMVDAAIGGKNGINVGVYKNMVGVIRQPEMILFDYSFLKSLPSNEWSNGFAEIIKHACIKSSAVFKLLEQKKLAHFRKNISLLDKLIQQNVAIKSAIVKADEFETGERKLLNFGHTLGHALENNYALAHGQAVAIGMVAACIMSKELTGFKDTRKVIQLIEQYELPVMMDFDLDLIMHTMLGDKKSAKSDISYILLSRIGKASVQQLTFEEVKQLLQKILDL